MIFKPIIIISGEPNSVFLEIFLKTFLKNKFKSPLILICSKKILDYHMKKLNIFADVNLINYKKIVIEKLSKNKINLIDVEYEYKYKFEKISEKTNDYITKCINIALFLFKIKISNKIINGPIAKKSFLKRKHLGITEYLAKRVHVNKLAMLIYNKKLAVCPITTHLPIKLVHKNISREDIINKIKLIDNFYSTYLNTPAKIGITGLNPHNESILPLNEDEFIIKPLVKKLKKLKININGPLPADTIFMKQNREKFNVIVGMYHDQVLTPIKTLFEFDAINVTLGLPFIRVSPDHGPNETMLGKNSSSPISLIKSIQFLDR